MKRFTLALCIAIASLAGAKERTQAVYMFGFALSFQDSVCVMTDIQRIDSAFVNKEGFLQERTLYALQMENRLDEKGHQQATCVVFWNEKRATLEKQYAKLRKKYSGALDFKMQSLEGFKFVREQHQSEEENQ